ncbi:MAG: FtsW/RodA/SpoVE family cell cycle protein [Erysipelotrichaceae bacterium]|nr:FtsW/RodA/SpoVE family cell cycle protein [Erysipelotrichaceae bacterium]
MSERKKGRGLRRIIERARILHANSSMVIFFCILFLNVLSVVMVTSASISNQTDLAYIIKNGIKNAAYSLFCLGLYFAGMVSYKKEIFQKGILLWLLAGIGSLVLAWYSTRVFYGEGGIFGAYAWLVIPGTSFTIQPSEFIKPMIIALIASYMCDFNFNNIRSGLQIMWLPILLFIVLVGIVVFVQRDMGTGFIICAIAGITFLMPSHSIFRKLQRADMALIALVLVGFVALMNEDVILWLQAKDIDFLYVTLNRFRSAINPTFDITNASREIFNSLYSIATGGLWGVGLGNSVQKYGYINATESDYIFAIIVEETGIRGICYVFIPYILLLSTLIKYAFVTKKEYQKTILVGVASYLFVHLFLNIGGVTGLAPLTGIPLLLVSSGGSAQFGISLALGIAQHAIATHKLVMKGENL